MWKEEKHTTAKNVEEVFSDAYLMKTSGGRKDLALVFNDNAPINSSRLAMWRLRFGDCSWVSDYKTNYASQH